MFATRKSCMTMVVLSVLGTACGGGSAPPNGDGEIRDVRVVRTAARESKAETEDFVLDNCAGSEPLTRRLSMDAAVKKAITIGQTATAEAEASLGFPLTAAVTMALRGSITSAYEDSFEQFRSRTDEVEMAASPGHNNTYAVQWVVYSHESTVSFFKGGKRYQAPYSYTVRVPKLAGSKSEGCTGGAAPLPATVEVIPPRLSLEVGDAEALHVVVRDSAGNIQQGAEVDWSTGNASVARVDRQGRITAVGPGGTNVIAACRGAKGSAPIVVTAPGLGTLAIANPPGDLWVGQVHQLQAEAQDRRGRPLSGVVVTWRSDNPDVCAVAADGTLVGVTPGTTTVKAFAESEQAVLRVAVERGANHVPVGQLGSRIAHLPDRFKRKIGVLLPLTGSFAPYGHALLERVRGELVGLQLALADSEGRPDRAGSAVARLLASDRISTIVIGGGQSALSAAEQSLGSRNIPIYYLIEE